MIRLNTLRVLLSAAVLFSLPGVASAQSEPADAVQRPHGEFDEGLLVDPRFSVDGEPIDKRRDRPDIDRASEKTSVGEVLVWIPRVVLFPVYLVADFLVRRPFGFAGRIIEKYRVMPWYNHLTTWGDIEGDDPNGGVVPVFRLDKGSRIAFGLLYYIHDLFAPGNDYQVRADTDFNRNITLDARGKVEVSDRVSVGAFGQLERRDDFLFRGIGAETLPEDETRFLRKKLFAGLESTLSPGNPGLGGVVKLEVSDNDFDCSDRSDLDICGADNVVDTADDRFATAADLPYFISGYEMVRLKLRVFYDSRKPRPAGGTGVRATAFGRWAHGVGSSSSAIHFLRYGGELAGFWDILNHRVLALRFRGELASPLDSGDIPFAELITLGGVETMRGFLHASFHGRSAVVSTLEYRYPAWSFFDGSVFVEAGNVFGENFDGFELDAMRGSAGFGIRTNENRHTSLDILLAVGTTRFDNPDFGIDHFRFTLGTNWGF